MEVFLLSLLFVAYLSIRYFVMDHETPAEKDMKRFQTGLALIKNRDFEAAFTYFDTSVRQHPKSAVAYASRGKCQLALGNCHSAIYDVTQAISLDNTLADCYLDRGMALHEIEQFTEAFREFDKAVWYFRDEQPDAYRWRAVARVKLNQVQQAESDLRRAVLLGDENSFHLLQQPPFVKRVYQNR
ncbi:MAG: hypothetical protein H7Z72_25740 [Bacteroidetes bacterium]|nr:hypothetical protein [Fibrella sp.]